MDKKKIIQIVIIIVAFVGSGMVLYNGLYKNSTPAIPPMMLVAPQQGSAMAAGAANPLLPYGGTLDFAGTVESRNFQFDAMSFPTLNTSTEVGIYDPVAQTYNQPLIQPAPTSK